LASLDRSFDGGWGNLNQPLKNLGNNNVHIIEELSDTEIRPLDLDNTRNKRKAPSQTRKTFAESAMSVVHAQALRKKKN
jgi:hypothetical protein